MIWPYLLRRNYQDLESMVRVTGSHNPEYTKYILNNTPDMDVAHFLQQVFLLNNGAIGKVVNAITLWLLEKIVIC